MRGFTGVTVIPFVEMWRAVRDADQGEGKAAQRLKIIARFFADGKGK
jgi:hypothetical protein